MPGLRIGELAARAQCPVETIRYYEKEGLLAGAGRSAANYRVYGGAHVERLRFIRNCRSLDMTLAEIRALLRFREAPRENCGAVNALLDAHIGHVATRIDELRKMEIQLKRLRRLCHNAQKEVDCGILAGLSAVRAEKPRDLDTRGRA